MTVSYQYDVASSASGGFIRLLFRWKGSVWKVVYREMLIFTVSYITLTILYQFALSESQQRIFERIVFFCSTFMDLIPLSFMLGFYVSFIAARWWSQFIAIPWPDKLMNIIAMYIPGFDEDSRVVRRTLMRYLNLSLVLVLRSISMAVKRRFPTKEHLIEAGFMTKTELEMFQSVPSTEFNTFWIPCTWFINVLRAARQECRITDSNGLKLIMEELNEFRSKCGLLWGYDWISIPLVYTQVVTMATYAFYVACMFGRQNVNVMTDKASSPEVHRYDYYIPIFTILQLMFYMGLLKVAEQLINPFGDDDEDFELNWIIDRHMKVSYLGVDTLNSEPPPLVKDTYYNELDVKIPYTEASKSYKKKTYRGSVAYMQVPMEGQGMVMPEMPKDEDDGEQVSETMGQRRPSVYTLFGGKGVSPSGSFTNLDNRSISSFDSDWKSSLPNLVTAKNASGTLGDYEQEEVESDAYSSSELHKYDQGGSFVVDMAKAEDDEIVLQEVIIDKSELQKPLVQRSDSLQIPGTLPDVPRLKEPTTALSFLRGLSPKIAPKFPREKLKSMFKKRRLSSAFPFYKLKGVRFSRDTKNDQSINQSLLDVSYQDPVEVEITLSTPELTEFEKETGVHPYYFTQQAITSAKQLVTDKAVIMRQPILEQSDSEKEKLQALKMSEKFLVRSSSLPNIANPDDYARYMQDPIITCSLKKISEAIKRKQKSQKVKVKKKSPPPKYREIEKLSGDTQESESPSDTESISRRSTLPAITVTKCEPKAPEHLDLATQSSSSGHFYDRVSDTKIEKTPPETETAQQKSIQQPLRSSQQGLERVSVTPEKVESAPKPHSTPKKPRMPSPPCVEIVEAESSKGSSSKPLPRRRSPPPKRPDKLSFSKQHSKKIAGIALKNIPPSPTSASTPTSPASAIPSSSSIGHAPSFPKSQKKTVKTSVSPKHSPTSDVPKAPHPQVPRTHADTVIKISDSEEDLTEIFDQSHPPEPPQRHLPRTAGKGKK